MVCKTEVGYANLPDGPQRKSAAQVSNALEGIIDTNASAGSACKRVIDAVAAYTGAGKHVLRSDCEVEDRQKKAFEAAEIRPAEPLQPDRPVPAAGAAGSQRVASAASRLDDAADGLDTGNRCGGIDRRSVACDADRIH
jgi:hypothetical protein